MTLRGFFLSGLVLLGLEACSYAATATWSEEMNDDPSPARWGVCTGEPAPSPYSACSSSKFVKATEFRNAITATGGIWQYAGGVGGDISHGMGVLDGPLGSSRPSPIAGAAQFTVEFKFRSTTLLADMLVQPTPAAWNFPIAVSSDSTGNVPWTFKYGLQANVGAPSTTLQLSMNAAAGGQNFVNVSESTVPYDDQPHVVRVIQNYTGDQLDGNPSSGYMDVYLDNVLIKKNGTDVHTFNLADVVFNDPFVAKVTRNRTFYIHQDNQGSGSSSLPFEMDYLRTINSIVPIGQPLNAPVTGCGGDVSGSTAGVPDGTTDGADLAYLYNHWGAVPVGTLGDIAGTTGPDGVVDGADVGKVYNCWAQADGAPTPVVPEPASIGILGLGLVGLLAARRRS